MDTESACGSCAGRANFIAFAALVQLARCSNLTSSYAKLFVQAADSCELDRREWETYLMARAKLCWRCCR